MSPMRTRRLVSLCHFATIVLCLESAAAYAGLQSWCLNDPACGSVVRQGYERRHQLKHIHEQQPPRGRMRCNTLRAKSRVERDGEGSYHGLSDAEKEVRCPIALRIASVAHSWI